MSCAVRSLRKLVSELHRIVFNDIENGYDKVRSPST